jgi:hypothetical protein
MCKRMEGNLLLRADRHPVERAADGSQDIRTTKEKFADVPDAACCPAPMANRNGIGGPPRQK